MLELLFINYLECLGFLVLYKKKFIYATILTNLTYTLLDFCTYKIFLTYASFSVIFLHIGAKIFS